MSVFIPSTSRPRLFGRVAGVTTAAVLTGAALSGCSPQPPTAQASSTSECEVPGGFVLAQAVHENAVRNVDDPTVSCYLKAAIGTDAPLWVMGLDGTPTYTVADEHIGWDPGGANAEAEFNAARAALQQVVGDLGADAHGNRLDLGLNKFGEAAARAGGQATVVVASPGTADGPVVDLTPAAVGATDPEEFAGAVLDTGAIASLEGVHIVWVGLGQAAGTQQVLSQPQLENLQAIWAAIIEGAGGAVEFVPGDIVGETVDAGSYTVRPVEPMQLTGPAPQTGTTVAYDDTSAFGFAPDTTAFRDQPAAETAAGEIARWIAPGDRRIELVGTTAAVGDEQSRRELSQRRAQAVAELIVAQGGDRSRITATGLGSEFPDYVEDRHPDGSLDPVAAVHNRSVRVTYLG
ncbi:OmpA family protein [Kocuria sp. CPCC 205268]|uniref:OmpA family protein n=1 Tax=Kocuria oxytropis TaxID=3058913 RepID=UPI0034D5CE52